MRLLTVYYRFRNNEFNQRQHIRDGGDEFVLLQSNTFYPGGQSDHFMQHHVVYLLLYYFCFIDTNKLIRYHLIR